jgi:hypothetical protein
MTSTTTYRDFNIVRERATYGIVIWVETDEGPIDVASVADAHRIIDLMIEEKQQLAGMLAAAK